MKVSEKARIQFTVTFHTNTPISIIFERGEVEDESQFVRQLEDRIRDILRRNLPCPGLGPEVSLLNPRFEYWGEEGGLFTARLVVVGSATETATISL